MPQQTNFWREAARRAPRTLLAILALALLPAGCKTLRDNNQLGTFTMGQKVDVGPLSYSVLEATWRNSLTGGPAGKVPKNRFLLLRVSITNGGGQPLSLPLFHLIGPDGKEHPEETEGVDGVSQWLGLLRTVKGLETQVGTVLFDVSKGDYKLRVSDGGELGSEKTALIEIPLKMAADGEEPVTP